MAPAFAVVGLPLLYVISRYNYNLFHALPMGFQLLLPFLLNDIWNSRILGQKLFYCGRDRIFLFLHSLILSYAGKQGHGHIPEYGNWAPPST
jgi:hypothetical protein